jgi:putative FmdB family regulatory protein
MPLYEYACEKCGKVFEVMQKFADEHLKIHEECGGKVDRLLSVPALHFKGSGFYVTDYAKGNGNANAAPPKHSEGKGSSESSNSEGSKSDKSKSEGSKSEGSKSEGSKSESSKSDSGSSSSSASTPAPAASTSKSDSKS